MKYIAPIATGVAMYFAPEAVAQQLDEWAQTDRVECKKILDPDKLKLCQEGIFANQEYARGITEVIVELSEKIEDLAKSVANGETGYGECITQKEAFPIAAGVITKLLEFEEEDIEERFAGYQPTVRRNKELGRKVRVDLSRLEAKVKRVTCPPSKFRERL
jgi:hypothetical protein